jgi:hypothetical protein
MIPEQICQHNSAASGPGRPGREAHFPQITFTVLTAEDGSSQSKRHTLQEDGSVRTVPPKFAPSGTMKVVRDGLNNFPAYFDTGSVAILGVPKGAKPGDEVPMTLKNVKRKGAIARTAENFEWVDGESPLMFDVDLKQKHCHPAMPAAFKFADLQKMLCETLALSKDTISATSFLSCPSASAGLKCEATGEVLKDSSSRHYYTCITGATPTEALGCIYKRAVILGYGCAFVHSDGSVSIKTPIDHLVAQPYRLDYAAPPTLGPGLVRDAKGPQCRPGVPLDLSSVNLTLSAKEIAQYELTVRDLKSAPQIVAIRNARLKDWAAQETEKRVAKGQAKDRAQKDVDELCERMRKAPNGVSLDIYPRDGLVFHFADGRSVSLEEIFKEPRSFHGCDLADPYKQDDRHGAARFFANESLEGDEFGGGHGQSFVINSNRAGGRRFFLHAEDPIEPEARWEETALGTGHKEGATGQDSGSPLEHDEKNSSRVPRIIAASIARLARVCGVSVGDFAAAIEFDVDALHRIVTAIIFSQSNEKFVLLTPSGEYRVFPEKRFTKGWKASLGEFYNARKLNEFLCTASESASDDTTRAEILRGQTTIDASLAEFINTERQFSDLTFKVDMFSRVASVRLFDGRAHLTFPHMRFDEGKDAFDTAVIADYKEHWSDLDEFLDLLAAARFAAARKKAYLWIHASSDWGKGFLEGALDHHGLVVSLSVRELEKMADGGPVGRQMTDFKRAWILLFNEFKSAKSELKTLEQSVSFSPKFAPVCKVDTYLKLFASAEGVDSLVSVATGVEDQFANRFSLIQPEGNLDNREEFKRIGRLLYLESLCNYVGVELNRRVDEYLALGRQGAANRGDAFIDEFHKRKGIGNTYKKLSVKLDDLCADFMEWLLSEFVSARHKLDSQVRGGQIPCNTERDVYAACHIREAKVTFGEDEKYKFLDDAKTPVPEGAKILTQKVEKQIAGTDKGTEVEEVPYVEEVLATKVNKLLTLWLDTEFNRAERGKLTIKENDMMKRLPERKSHRYGRLGHYQPGKDGIIIGCIPNTAD